MGPSGDSTHQVKKVVLPSGKTIEVVLFGEGGRRAAAADATDLHVCPECGSELVYPTSWEEAGDDGWRVAVRCPECEHRHEGLYDQTTVDAFDEELEAGTDELVADYRRLMRANMANEVERFAEALDAGAVLPEDF